MLVEGTVADWARSGSADLERVEVVAHTRDSPELASTMADRDGEFSLSVPANEYFALELTLLDGVRPDRTWEPTAHTHHAAFVGEDREWVLYRDGGDPSHPWAGCVPEDPVGGYVGGYTRRYDPTADDDDPDHRTPEDRYWHPDDFSGVLADVVAVDGAGPTRAQVCTVEVQRGTGFVVTGLEEGFHTLELHSVEAERPARATFLVYVPARGFAPIADALLTSQW